jgi:hypothetical protein
MFFSYSLLLLLLCTILVSSIEEGDIFFFAYGSDMQYHSVVEKVGRVTTVGPAILDNWEFRFNKFGSDGTGKANIVENGGKSLYGVLYKCSPRQLDSLDQFEGVPGHANREPVKVKLQKTGEYVDAITYRASKRMTINPGLPPSTAYLTAMLEGAKQFNFPVEFGIHLQSLLDQLGYVPDNEKQKHREL